MTKGTGEEKIDFAISGSIDIAGRSISYSAGAWKKKGSVRLMLELPAMDAGPLLRLLSTALGDHFMKKAATE